MPAVGVFLRVPLFAGKDARYACAVKGGVVCGLGSDLDVGNEARSTDASAGNILDVTVHVIRAMGSAGCSHVAVLPRIDDGNGHPQPFDAGTVDAVYGVVLRIGRPVDPRKRRHACRSHEFVGMNEQDVFMFAKRLKPGSRNFDERNVADPPRAQVFATQALEPDGKTVTLSFGLDLQVGEQPVHLQQWQASANGRTIGFQVEASGLEGDEPTLLLHRSRVGLNDKALPQLR